MAKRDSGAQATANHVAAISRSGYNLVVDVNGAVSPRVTVIVPTFNRRDMLVQTIDALSSQDFGSGYEIIVIDNASQDGTEMMLRKVAERAPCSIKVVRLKENRGPAYARNVGLSLARGEFVCFTDDDCIPAPGWLTACAAALDAGYDAIQGRTMPPPWQRKPLLSHYIQTASADGLFSTANAAYRRSFAIDVGGFNPACDYWEDVDLGWRTVRSRASYGFAPEALVWHQVIVQPARVWLKHALRFSNWPLIASRYPEFRRHLFLGVWVDSFHVLMTLGAAGVVLSTLKRPFALLAVPYLVAFPFRHGLRGRWPVLKAAAHLTRDCLGFAALLWGSLRHKSPVL